MLFHKFNSLVWERQGQVAPRSEGAAWVGTP